MPDMFLKEFRILNPHSSIGRRLRIEGPALVSPIIKATAFDGHNIEYGPLVYGVGIQTFSQNYCRGPCSGGIWVYERVPYVDSYRVIAHCEVSHEKKIPWEDKHHYAVMWVRPVAALQPSCLFHPKIRLAEGFLTVMNNELIPVCNDDLGTDAKKIDARRELHRLSPFTFRIEDGDISFQLAR